MKQSSCISLPEDMTIGNIGECQSELFSALNKVKEVSVDLSTLQQIDTAGVQLLLVFIREASTSQVKLIWLKQSDILSAIEKKLGFNQMLSGSAILDESAQSIEKEL